MRIINWLKKLLTTQTIPPRPITNKEWIEEQDFEQKIKKQLNEIKNNQIKNQEKLKNLETNQITIIKMLMDIKDKL